MTTSSKIHRILSLAGLALLISGCATDPRPPSFEGPHFTVLVKGERGPLETFAKQIADPVNARTLDGCVTKIPQSAREAVSKSEEPGQLVWECAGKGKAEGDAQLALFAKAYSNSIASLLEMKITTASTCVARSCYGGALRYWYQSPPCTYPC